MDEETIAELEQQGALDSGWLRNFRIRQRFAELKRDGKKSGEAIRTIADEFHLSLKRADAIVYGYEKKS